MLDKLTTTLKNAKQKTQQKNENKIGRGIILDVIKTMTQSRNKIAVNWKSNSIKDAIDSESTAFFCVCHSFALRDK